MESFEIDLDGQTRRIKVVKDLCGHSIEPYLIHGEKSVPCIAVEDNTKMEEGEVFAIETFGTTGKGKVRERGETSHFMIEKNMFGKSNLFKSRKTRSLLAHIKQ